MATHDLLIEIGTEELPPKFLKTLSHDFKSLVADELHQQKLTCSNIKTFAAPRRIALIISDLKDRQDDYTSEKKGPPVAAAYKNNEPTPALIGFAKSCGVPIESLQKFQTEKGEWFIHTETIQGKETIEIIPQIIEHALNKLPIAKRMRWANHDFEFVRPLRWLVVLYGEKVINTEIMGVSSCNTTRGHRFHAPQEFVISKPTQYESILENEAYVIPDFEKRQSMILKQIDALTESYGKAIILPELLDEVTALVEYPKAMIGKFEEHFLNVPQEALISTMQDNQKYFPIVDQDGKLTQYFCFVSNIDSKQPEEVISGNERVIRPRFSDADFFWNSDKDIPLETYLPRLETTIFQKQLGSQKDKMDRVAKLCDAIATEIGGDKTLLSEASRLYKSDLLSNMVQEFPELQGIMGRYYATHQGKHPIVAAALEQVYWPKFSGDQLPESKEAQILAISERLDTIVGIFAIGQIPSGSRDPFSLRRASLGILRILVEKEINLDLKPLIHFAMQNFESTLQSKETEQKVLEYILERMRAYALDLGIRHDTYDAVNAKNLSNPLDIYKRLTAVEAFRKLPETKGLVQSNKRITNILQKNLEDQTLHAVNEALLEDSDEKVLYQAIQTQHEEIEASVKSHDYMKTLTALAALDAPLEAFFANVMVMSDNLEIRNNRLNLLNQIQKYFQSVADVSLLQEGA